MSFGEGELTLRLRVEGGRVAQVEVQSTRPPKLGRLLEGRPVGEVARLVPALFSVCRVGQGVCALAALGLPQPSDGSALALEALEHHAWHFDVEWPRALGLEPNTGALRETLARLRAGPGPQLVEHLRAKFDATFDPGSAGAQFLHRAQELDRGLEWPEPRLATPTLSECEAGLSDSADFAARPGPFEVGSLARASGLAEVAELAKRLGWGLELRARARVLDARHAVERLAAQDFPTVEVIDRSGGVRAAMVQVARGPLVHRVVREGDRTVGWRSVAPTEWTFHPRGAVQALVGSMALEVQHRARLYVTLLDPCVRCALEVVNA
jgi:hypothetical protein